MGFSMRNFYDVGGLIGSILRPPKPTAAPQVDVGGSRAGEDAAANEAKRKAAAAVASNTGRATTLLSASSPTSALQTAKTSLLGSGA